VKAPKLLSGSGTKAIIIGTGRHVEGSVLPSVPAVACTVEALKRALIDKCGLSPDQLRIIIDPLEPGLLLEAVSDTAALASDIFLLYYVGHGALDRDAQLHLATVATKDISRAGAAYQALPFGEITKSLLAICQAREILVVLDCCYAYRAELPQQFSYALLASADRDEHALASPGGPYTLFSGELLRILSEGDPTGPPHLSVRDVHRRLHQTFPARNASAPILRSARNGGELILASNPAYVPPADPDVTDPDSYRGDDYCPYRGLDPYTTEDAGLFAGRDELTRYGLQQVRKHIWRGGLCVILGASGSGKSSLLNAGIIPGIRSEDIGVPGSASWPFLSFTPGEQPLQKFAQALASLVDANPSRTLAKLKSDPSACAALITRALAVPTDRNATAGVGERRLVVAIDQFEELFSPTTDEASRVKFLNLLESVATIRQRSAGNVAGAPAALVIITIRSDFYAAAARYPQLRGALSQRQIVVGGMNAQELHEAIVQPAHTAGLTLQPGLVDLLLKDIGADSPTGFGPVTLPYLSFALLQTWQRRKHRVLTVDGYKATGGVSDAIAQAAERAYQELPEPEQDAANLLLVDLVNAGNGTPDTRRRADRTSFLASQPDEAAASEAIRALSRSRLITLDQDTVQLAHEALILSWPRLRDLVDAERASLQIRQKASADAERWNAEGRKKSLLYSGEDLLQAKDLVRLGPTARAFIDQSIGRERYLRTRNQVFVGALGAVTAIAIIAGVALGWQVKVANRSAAAAVQQRNIATSDQLAAESETLSNADPATAALLAAASWQVAHTAKARESMFDAVAQPERAVFNGCASADYDVAFSPDSRIVATACQDGTVRLWSTITHQQAGHTINGSTSFGVTAVTFSPDGKILATGGGDGTVRLWNVATDREMGAPLRHEGTSVDGLNFTPDGRVIAASSSGKVWLWKAAGHGGLGSPLTGAASGIAFSPDSKVIATASGGGIIRLHSLSTGRQIGRPLRGAAGTRSGLAFTPNGMVIMASDRHGRILFWRVATHRRIQGSVPDAGSGFAFDARHQLVATASASGTVRIWSLRPVIQVSAPLTSGNDAQVFKVVFSRDGEFLATAETDGTSRLWKLSTYSQGAAPKVGYKHFPVNSTAFSPDGNLLAAASADGAIQVWNMETGLSVIPPIVLNGRSPLSFFISVDAPYHQLIVKNQAMTHHGKLRPAITGVAFLPGSDILVSACSDGFLRFWDAATGQQAAPPVQSGRGAASAVAFDSAGKLLASANTDGTVNLWDVTGRHAGSVIRSGDGAAVAVAFDPAGKLLASANTDGTVSVWNTATGQQAGPTISSGTGAAVAVAFDSAGKLLASANTDGTVRLWNAATNQQVGLPMTSGVSGLTGLAFSPGGELIATVGADGKLRVWDVATQHEIGAPIVVDGAVNQASDGSAIYSAAGVNAVAFSPDGKFLETSGGDGEIRQWNTNFPVNLVSAMCEIGGRSLTEREWHSYLPSTQYRAVCPGEPTGS
jgi:WD40 repeat protein